MLRRLASDPRFLGPGGRGGGANPRVRGADLVICSLRSRVPSGLLRGSGVLCVVKPPHGELGSPECVGGSRFSLPLSDSPSVSTSISLRKTRIPAPLGLGRIAFPAASVYPGQMGVVALAPFPAGGGSQPALPGGAGSLAASRRVSCWPGQGSVGGAVPGISSIRAAVAFGPSATAPSRETGSL